MRKLLIAAAALIAVVAPGVASAQTGYVGLGYANVDMEDSDSDGFFGEGVVAFDAGALGVQLDARVGTLDSDDNGDTDFWNIGGHVYDRGQQWLVGGFASIGNTDSGAGDTDVWAVGAEVQYYMARTTVGGALTYSEADDADLDGYFIDGEVKHFYTDNFSLNANLGLGQVESNGNDGDTWNAGVGAEYQFASAPVSIFGGYQHANIDLDGTDESDVDAITIGARWNFGGTLIERDRSGAGLTRRGGIIERVLGIS
jgi:hypothetical protein